MKADLKFVKEKFEEFNQLCFGGQLPPIRIRISSARTFMGKFTWRRVRAGMKVTEEYTLVISNNADRPASEIEDTVIHEMIHYYIRYKRLKDTSAHGELFCRMMNEINTRHGRNIQVRHHASESELKSDTRRRPHLICHAVFKSGKEGILIAPRTRIFRIWDHVERIADIRSFRWLLSFNPYFNRISRSMNVKFYIIDSAILASELSGADVIMRRGDKIYLNAPGRREDRPQ